MWNKNENVLITIGAIIGSLLGSIIMGICTFMIFKLVIVILFGIISGFYIGGISGVNIARNYYKELVRYEYLYNKRDERK